MRAMTRELLTNGLSSLLCQGAEHSVVGYECDGCEWSLDEDGLPAPTCRDGTPTSFVILGTAPAVWAPGDAWWRDDWDQDRVGSGCMGVYTNDAGGEVFTAGSTDWPHGKTTKHLCRSLQLLLE